MTDLSIPSSQSTPAVEGVWEQGLLRMEGDSYPENSFDFFSPVILWIEGFLTRTQRPLTLELRLIYMNTSSVKAMMDIFDMLEEAHREGRQVRVRWRYDPRNERVVEMAEDFREDCTFAFDIEADEADEARGAY
ncbi:biofilm regulation phosphoprotein SiaC [Geoalkalibacter sp.]|uniref:biofilm regulation phosphoprotein SiaC n=1 Tax=Geoalkalibacter sp. TaxID=3041440 RepID=UPI00272ED641|nr:biofilm regulation phosphoprotein SiaC [Geoalkalibacter sp.]